MHATNRKTRTVRKRNKETVSQASMWIMGEFAELQLSTSEGESDNAICPKCGVAYTDSEGLCVAMGVTGGCTAIKKKKLPDVYFCVKNVYTS